MRLRTQKYPLAVIDVDCPFFTGKTEALCMEDTLYDLVIGNFDGSKLPDMSHFSAAAVTRSKARQSEDACRKLKVPDQIINEDKLRLRIQTWIVLGVELNLETLS